MTSKGEIFFPSQNISTLAVETGSHRGLLSRKEDVLGRRTQYSGVKSVSGGLETSEEQALLEVVGAKCELEESEVVNFVEEWSTRKEEQVAVSLGSI